MNPGSCRHRILWLAALALGAVLRLAGADVPWPVTAEGLGPDPRWHWGRLDNGLRYVVRSNANPAGRVSYRFVVEVGGAHEHKEEAGFAHFVEHMAFNGTRHFKGETLAQELARRGIAFGPESTAFTFLSHTIYQFDTPGNTPAEIEWVLMVLRDFADGMLFEPQQVRRERGVIASEVRDRKTTETRYDQARRAELYPRSPLRSAIGVVPDAVTPAALKAFYDKWYRADRMILAVVGDADVATLEAAVRKQFTSMRAPVSPAPPFDPGPIENPPIGTTNIIHDPQASGLSLEIVSLTPLDRADSREERRRMIAGAIATFTLSQRIADIVRKSPGALSGGGARVYAPTPFGFEASVTILSPTHEWALAVEVLDSELRRSFQFTFHREEISLAKARFLKDTESADVYSSTAKSPDLAGWVMQQALWRMVSLSTGDELEFIRATLAEIDARAVNAAWRTFWQERRARIVGYGFFPDPNRNKLVDLLFAVKSQVPVTIPPAPAPVAFPYTDFGPPGVVRGRKHVAAVDIDMLEFENGVRANLKRTGFVAGHVDVCVRIGAGLLNEPPVAPGLGRIAANSLLNGGLGRIPQEELIRLFSTDPIHLNFFAGESGFLFSGRAPAHLVERMLQLICAYLTDPAWSRDAFTAAGFAMMSDFNEQLKTAEGVMQLNSYYLATHRDPRYRAVAPDELARLGLSDVKHWLNPILLGAPMEVGVVGDFPQDEIEGILARTLGALPARDPDPPRVYPARFRTEPGAHKLRVGAKTARTAIQIMWPAPRGGVVKRSRQLEVVSQVVEDRIVRRVREDLGAAYSPVVDYWKSDTPDEEGYLVAYVTTAPRSANRVSRLILAEVDKLVRQGATEDEFRQAITPILERTREQVHNNSYWLWRITPYAQSRPEVLEWPLTRTSDFENTTRDDINALIRELLPSAKTIRFTAAP